MELWLTGIGFFVASLIAASRGARPALGKVRWVVGRIALTPARAGASLLVICMLVYAAPSVWRVPTPVVHDEFAYLLVADTFAQARLANPPHALSQFFETFHVLQSPTYASKFPAGPAAMLALGQLFGLPIAGVWLSVALACLAMLWMLRAVLPLRWALLTSLLVAIHPTVLWFSQTYWGGGVAMLGGALLGGAMLRSIRSGPTAGMGWIAGAGIGILAISRPFEGILLAGACGVAMLILAVRAGALRPLMLRFAPAALVLPLIAVAWTMYYNARVTGDALLMPYALHTSRYMAAPLMFFNQMPATPTYPNATMRAFHTGVELSEYRAQVSPWILGAIQRAGLVTWGYLRPMLLLLPLIVALATARRLRNGWAIGVCMALCLAVLAMHLSMSPWMRLAYMAPLAGLLFVVIGLGLRQLNAWHHHGKPLGRVVVHAIVMTQVVLAGYVLVDGARRNADSHIARREQIVQALEKRGGEHLVLVHYSPDHWPGEEWVYNAADIDGAPVIFARDLGAAADEPLLRYYPNRTTWRLDVTANGATIHPLAEATADINPPEPSPAELP